MGNDLLDRNGSCRMGGSEQGDDFGLVATRADSDKDLFDFFGDKWIGVKGFLDKFVENEIQLRVEPFLDLKSKFIKRHYGIFAQRRPQILNQTHDLRHNALNHSGSKELAVMGNNSLDFVERLHRHLPVFRLDFNLNIAHFFFWVVEGFVFLTSGIICWLVVGRSVIFLSERF